MRIRSLRNAFLSGIILLAPVAITVYVIKLLIEAIGAPTSKIFFFFAPPEVFDQTVLSVTLNILSTLLVLVLVTFLGWLSQYFLGRLVVRMAESVLNNVPVVNRVYSTVKQIIDTFSSERRAVFQKVVLIEFPRKGLHSLGFLTGEGKGEVKIRSGKEISNVFLPTTPNPTSGFLIMTPTEELIQLDMSIGDGMKFIISGGAVVPVYDPETRQAKEVEVQNPPIATAPALESSVPNQENRD